MTKGLRLLLVGLLASFAALMASAHQQKVGQTDIRLNPRTGMVEIAHRFIIHDAEHAFSEALGRSVDLLGSEDERAQFASYVAAAFSLRPDQADSDASLTLIGSETEAGYIWIYQEMPVPEHVIDWQVHHAALHDLIPDQVNAVNIHMRDSVRTLTFSANSGAQRVRFDAGDRD